METSSKIMGHKYCKKFSKREIENRRRGEWRGGRVKTQDSLQGVCFQGYKNQKGVQGGRVSKTPQK